MSGDEVHSGSSTLTLYAAGGLVLAGIIGTFTHAKEHTVHIDPLVANVVLSVFAGIMTYKLIRAFRPLLIKAGMYGVDLNKERTDPPTLVPEPGGVIAGAVYLISLFLFIPFPFWLDADSRPLPFPHNKAGALLPARFSSLSFLRLPAQFAEFICALLSICCMVFLGFADDVLDLRWRHKLVLPTVASLPILMVYMINIGSTSVVMPMQLRPLLGRIVNLHAGYYVYMGMLAVFCTNAINILAGINGVEAGQSLIIALSIIANSCIQLYVFGESRENHQLALYLMIPFVAVTLALFYWNRYPSRVFVGDTFCYFAGMTFAVVGILGHFSKTMLLFFVPQIVNFLYSTPQLFKFIPCPRHRLPKYNQSTGLCEMSMACLNPDRLSGSGRLMFWLLVRLRLVHIVDKRAEKRSAAQQKGEGKAQAAAQYQQLPVGAAAASGTPEDPNTVEINNLTIINAAIRVFGPQPEWRLTNVLLAIQVLCSVGAFFIRYYLVRLVYEE